MRRFSNYLYQNPKTFLVLLLSLPLGWMIVVYLVSLFALLIQSFFHLDGFTGQVVREFTFATYYDLFTESHFSIILRTVSMAFSVTIASVIIAFPLAYYAARYASKRAKTWLYFAVVMPLWSSYIIRVYAWKLILAKEGVFNWFVTKLGLGGLLEWVLQAPMIGGTSLSVSYIGLFLVFVYIWLPYMILPIQTALERIPPSLIEASGDLGAKPRQTFWKVVFPLTLPGIVAGSIFTFSLTLGDYIIPSVVGDSSPFIGVAVYSYQGTSGNIPLAAAFTVVPMVIMVVYLLIARKMGAFEAL
jgi:putative spermidine/putrescine transport system permease protein